MAIAVASESSKPDVQVINDFVLPAQGALRWVDSLAVPVNAPNPNNALLFMDFYLQPEISARVSNFIRYDTANAAAVSMLDAGVRDDPIVFPPADVLRRLSFTANLGPDTESSTRTAGDRCKEPRVARRRLE
jgi:spermidine/putrescine-binding protein